MATSTTAAACDELEEKLSAVVDALGKAIGPLTSEKIRAKTSGAKKDVVAAIKLGEQRGFIVQHRVGARRAGYKLTSAGTAFFRGDSGSTSAAGLLGDLVDGEVKS